MGGDGVITHELSDRLAEDLMNERFTALVSHLDNGEHYLSAEWVSAMFRMRDKERTTGRQLYTPDLFAFAAKQSSMMKGLDWLGGYDIKEMFEGKPSKLYRAATKTYYAHSGIHSMYHRRDRLEAMADIYRFRAELREDDDYLQLRRLANMNEELAFYDMLDNQPSKYLQEARSLNQFLIDGMDSWHHPHRIHALFSMFDLEATEFLTQTDAKLRSQDIHHGLKQIHIGLNNALVFIADQIDEYAERMEHDIGQIEDCHLQATLVEANKTRLSFMSGALAEGVAMSVLQGHILDAGHHNSVWVRQAFMREDSMNSSRLEDNAESENLEVPNLSFDIQIYNHQDAEARNIPIEVKKARKVSRASLHPDIQVISFRDARENTLFAERARIFANKQVARHKSGDNQTRPRVHKKIYKLVNPAGLLAHI